MCFSPRTLKRPPGFPEPMIRYTTHTKFFHALTDFLTYRHFLCCRTRQNYSRSTGFAYDPKAPQPAEWLEFLGTLWPDDNEGISTLQEIFGYFLSGDLRQQKLFLLVGPKRAGKGTIARVLRMLLGHENVSGPTLSSLGQPFGLEPLIGKR